MKTRYFLFALLLLPAAYAGNSFANWNYYPINANTSSLYATNDLSGNNRTAFVYNGPTWSSDESFYFNGNDQYIRYSNGVYNLASSAFINNGFFSAWFNMTALASGQTRGRIVSGGQSGCGTDGLMLYVQNDSGTLHTHGTWYDGTSYNDIAGTDAVTLNTWHHIVMTWSPTSLIIYLDGNVESNRTKANNTFYIGSVNSFCLSGTTYDFVGEIDEAGAGNVTLTTANVTTILNAGHNGSGGSIGGFGNSNITYDFGSQIGTIDVYKMGAVTHGFLKNGTTINYFGNVSSSDFQYMRALWLAAHMTIARIDMSLDSSYVTLPNTGMEYWTTDRLITTKTQGNASFSASNDVPIGWKDGAGSTSGSGGNLSQSTDAHSGNYSINITGDANATNSLFIFIDVSDLPLNHNYTVGAWVKSPNSGHYAINIQRLSDFSGACTASGTATSSWQNVNCTFNPNSTLSQGYRLPFQMTTNGTILFDDAYFLQDGVPYDYFTYSANYLEWVKWFHDNGLKMLWIIDYMPSSLAQTVPGCDSLAANVRNCPPANYSRFGDVAARGIYYLTSNGTYNDTVVAEVWNEPYGGFFLKDYSTDDIRKVQAFMPMYNATYDAVKAKFPNMLVGGPAGLMDSVNFMNYFLCGVGSRQDFVSIHRYSSNLDLDFKNDVDSLYSISAGCGINVTRIFMDEWQESSASIKNSTNTTLYVQSVSRAFMYGYSHHVNDLDMLYYQWSESYSYSDVTHRLAVEYPQLWEAMSDPGLDNKNYSIFNVQYNISNHFPVGAKMYAVTANEPFYYGIAGVYNNTTTIALFNNVGTVTNASLILSSISATTVTDDNGTQYAVTNGTVTINNLEPGVIHYYTVNTGCTSGMSTSFYVNKINKYYLGTFCIATEPYSVPTKSCTKAGGCV